MNSNISKLAYAMNASATTSNGAVSLMTPDPSHKSSGRMSLFFKSVYGLNAPLQYQYIATAELESTLDTFLLGFHIRDCRGGKGERDIGRRCLVWLFINKPSLFSKVMHLIPEYGRWDDLLHFFPGVLDLSDIEHVRQNYCSIVPNRKHLIVLQTLQKQIVKLMGSKIREDYALMISGKPCSLVAKWSPTEGDSLDRKYGVYKTLASEMQISRSSLRKTFLTPLRSYIKIVERFMCNNEWGEIDYNKVPSCAMKRLKKSFEKHDESRFQEWRNALKNGDVKVCAKQLYPHELVREMRKNGKADGICEAQWKIIEEECVKHSSLKDDVVVVDTSTSMYSPNYLPYDVAIAMGLLISRSAKGKFKNHVITFNDTPKLVILNGEASIYNQWLQLSQISWGGSTNIEATFKLILDRGKICGLTHKDMPKRLWIISDMQFNKVSNYGQVTNFEAIDKMYTASGYTRPQIVFWNVNGESLDFPVTSDDNGTALISGFSPSVMNAILYGSAFSPYSVMRKTLESDRLRPVRVALG